MTNDYKTLWWVRSLAADVDHYRVEQQRDGGDWVTIATVPVVQGKWSRQQITDRLVDLAEYTWRVVPVDTTGNDGTPVTIGPERIVRTPDAPEFVVSFDPATSRVSFDHA